LNSRGEKIRNNNKMIKNPIFDNTFVVLSPNLQPFIDMKIPATSIAMSTKLNHRNNALSGINSKNKFRKTRAGVTIDAIPNNRLFFVQPLGMDGIHR